MKKVLFAALSLCFITAAIPAFAENVLYTNGPGNYSLGASDIYDPGAAVANSFVLSRPGIVTGASVGLWADMVTSLDWAITSDALYGSVYGSGTAIPTNTAVGVNFYNFGEDIADFSIPGVSLAAGTYWFQLSNAKTSTSGLVFWDLNNGPSDAVSFGDGNFGSEAFTLFGDSAATPEPSSLGLLCTGLLSMGGIIRRKFTTQA